MSIIRIAGSALLVLLCGLFPFYLRLVDYLFFHPATEQLDALHPLLPLAVLLTLSASLLWTAPRRPVLASSIAMLLFAAVKYQADETIPPPSLKCASGSKCVVLVTGANSGIGFAVAESLLDDGHSVVLGCRSQRKCDAAITRLPSATRSRAVAAGGLDLGSFAAVRSFVGALPETLQKLPRSPTSVHMLVANAGMVPDEETPATQDGFEPALGVAYFGHHALLKWMMAAKPAALFDGSGGQGSGSSTAVFVSSHAAMHGRFHVSSLYGNGEGDSTRGGEGDLRGELTRGCSTGFLGESPPLLPVCPPTPVCDGGSQVATAVPTASHGAYARAKLANILHAKELHRRFPAVATASVHPGMVATPLAEKQGPKMMPIEGKRALLEFILRSPKQAAAIVLNAAAAAQRGIGSGCYFGGGGAEQAAQPPSEAWLGRINPQATDSRLAQRLWDVADEKLDRFVAGDGDASATVVEARKTPHQKLKVFVSGCFDLMHSGHVAFFKQASKLGDLYVSVGNDANIRQLKNHDPMFPEKERVYMVQSVRYVHKAFVAQGMGHDQRPDLAAVKPDMYFVNTDGDKPEKRKLCEELGIQYIVEDRVPDAGLPKRSSTSIKKSLAKSLKH